MEDNLIKRLEKVENILYDINAEISLKCIGMKKVLTPKEIEVLNQLLGVQIKELRLIREEVRK